MGDKKNEPEEKEDTNSWMTTYSDMVTLLFAFFVLMFAISNVDQKKFALVAAAFSGTLTLDTFNEIQLQYGDSLLDLSIPSLDAPVPSVPDDSGSDGGTGGGDNPAVDTGGGFSYFGDSRVTALYEGMSEFIGENDLASSVTVEHIEDSLLLTVANDIYFPSGSAEMPASALPSVDALGKLLFEYQDPDDPFEIVVVGHTDNIPQTNPRYESNWELSMARATNFMRALIRSSNISQLFFSARGHGENMPVADNSTPEGRQQNRRVEVMISYKGKPVPDLQTYMNEQPGGGV